MLKTLYGLAVIVATLFVLHNGFRFYQDYREIRDFSYQSLNNYLGEHPDDETFQEMIVQALHDEKISDYEFKGIVLHIMDSQGYFKGAAVGVDHSGCKEFLIQHLNVVRVKA